MSEFFTFEVAVILANLAVTFIGMTMQARAFRNSKNTESASLLFYALLAFSLILSIAYMDDQNVFLLPCKEQLVLTICLSMQVIYYRKYPGGYRVAQPRLA